MLDETDYKILRALQSNPTASVVELAQLVGLSHTPCWRRLKRLEEEAVIVERAVILNPKLLGVGVSVFAHVRLRLHDEDTLEAFERAANDRAEIVECFSMSGESDYLLRVVAHSIDDYEQLMKKVLLHLPGVATINSSFALKSIKMTTKLPI